ncbi:MAG: glycosyltransferase [Acidimicrobiales bacterium]|jgi:cellulose synthase (UDP-forming)
MTPEFAAMREDDVRRETPVEVSPERWKAIDRRLRVLIPIGTTISVAYLLWLLLPERVGNPYLYWALIGAQIFNFIQGMGFMWTIWPRRRRPTDPALVGPPPDVDIFIPVYNEPLDVVAPVVAAAGAIRGGVVNVFLLDDAGRPELADLAEEWGASYIHRGENLHAKAGNMNHALRFAKAPFLAVFDCDHVPDPGFLEATLAPMQDPDVAVVQTPQYYSNSHTDRLAAAASSQQELFFGAIGRGKDTYGGMICCGTNFLIRRVALDEVGGWPFEGWTEDLELSIKLQHAQWKIVYLTQVLARGLGPEDMSAYISQQLRWARGGFYALGLLVRGKMPVRVRLLYSHSCAFWLTGWTILVYLSLPVIFIFTGAQPFNGSTASQMLLYFAPFFAINLIVVATAGGNSYTFDAFCVFVANFWVHIAASIYVMTGAKMKWVVTSKQSSKGREPRSVVPGLAYLGVFLVTAVYGIATGFTPAVADNLAFAAIYAVVILVGIWPALAGAPTPSAAAPEAELEAPELEAA